MLAAAQWLLVELREERLDRLAERVLDLLADKLERERLHLVLQLRELDGV